MNDGPADAGRVELGKIVGLWGVRGWVKVYSYTRRRDGIADYPEWILAGEPEQRVKVLNCQRQGGGLVARIDGVTDRDQARRLIGRVIQITESELPELPAGEFYWRQLVGLKVQSLGGDELGVVDHLLETGANDVLVVSGADRERLLPYVPEVVKEVDLQARLMRVDWQADWDAD